MRVPHYLIRVRRGFAFQIVVPLHLRAALARQRVRHSLGTLTRADAQRAALHLAAHYAQVFQACETGAARVSKDKANRWEGAANDAIGRTRKTDDDDLLGSALRALDGRGPTYQTRFGPNGPELETDGTPDDHTRGMEAHQANLNAWMKIKHAEATATAKAVAIPAAPPSAAMGFCRFPNTPLGTAYAEWARLEQARLKEPKSWLAKRKALTDFVADRGEGALVSHLLPSDLSYYAAKLAIAYKGSTAPTKMGYIGEFFDYCEAQGYYPQGAKNPARGLLTYGTKERDDAAERGAQPFTADEVRQLFHADTFGQLDVLNRWQVLLMAYTGARSDDIAHLALADIHHDSAPEVGWWFQVRGGKTNATARKVPIHAELIAMGFAAWVEARRAEGARHLFPNLPHETMNGPQQRVQKDFVAHMKRAGVSARPGTKGGGHAWRDTVVETLDEAGVEQSWRERYVGHEVSGRPSTLSVPHARNYGRNESPTKTQATLRHLRERCHPSLAWVARGIIDGKAMASLMADTALPKVKRRGPNKTVDPTIKAASAERRARREAHQRGEPIPPAKRGPKPKLG